MPATNQEFLILTLYVGGKMLEVFFTDLHQVGTDLVVKTKIVRQGAEDVIREFRTAANKSPAEFTAQIAKEVAAAHGLETELHTSLKSWVAGGMSMKVNPADYIQSVASLVAPAQTPAQTAPAQSAAPAPAPTTAPAGQ